MTNHNHTNRVQPARINPSPAANRAVVSKRAISWRGVRNTLRMGHCAPTVLQTLLEERKRMDDTLVQVAGGLAGGIGGSGECGGICAPLMLFGLEHGAERDAGGVPRAIILSQEYLHRFKLVHGGQSCRDVSAKGMGGCLKAIGLAPALTKEVAGNEKELAGAFPSEARAAYLTLLSAFERRRFHCAHRVLDELHGTITVTETMRRSSWVFIGGLALSGLTCGALAAGVMAISARTGGVERSYARTLRMILTLMVSVERGLRDERNASNRPIRIAGELAKWFEQEYGSTRCANLTGADFRSPRAVEAFCAAGLERCETCAQGVASKVRELLTRECRGVA